MQAQSQQLRMQNKQILEQQEETRQLREHVDNCVLCGVNGKVSKILSLYLVQEIELLRAIYQQAEDTF